MTSTPNRPVVFSSRRNMPAWSTRLNRRTAPCWQGSFDQYRTTGLSCHVSGLLMRRCSWSLTNMLFEKLRRKPDSSSHGTPPASVGALHAFEASPYCTGRHRAPSSRCRTKSTVWDGSRPLSNFVILAAPIRHTPKAMNSLYTELPFNLIQINDGPSISMLLRSLVSFGIEHPGRGPSILGFSPQTARAGFWQAFLG